eukprot:comp22314_c0_seq1/m.53478 comp22314_c0_seq1/g.53478  ORF comp22314_c0_seq1/g.53478 comp22314_c0_seq1/m.53478 type:complete len:355 (-) comp22314_c0_seq1:1206-2270(-)
MQAHRRRPCHLVQNRGRHAPRLACLLVAHRPRCHHRLQHSKLRYPVSSRPRCSSQNRQVSLLGQDHQRQDNHEKHHIFIRGIRHPREQVHRNRRTRPARHAPGHPARLQTHLLLPQLGLGPLSERAKGRRAPFNHLRSAQRLRRGPPPSRRLLSQGRPAAAAPARQAHDRLQLHGNGARHRRAHLVFARARPADQGHVAALPHRESAGSADSHFPQQSIRGKVRRRNRHRAQARLLRQANRNPRFRIPVPVHHARTQPLLLDIAQPGRRAQAQARRLQSHPLGALLCQAIAEEGPPAHDSRKPAQCTQARQGRPEKGHRPHGEGRARRPPACAQDLGKLRVRIHRCHRGPAALS